jgi:two-component system chemotaxis sensor kinase CheA
MKPELEKQYAETDLVIGHLESFLQHRDLSKLPPRLAGGLGAARKQLDQRSAFRAKVDAEAVSVDEVLAFYGGIDDALISATAALAQLSDDGELLRSISSLVALSELSERTSDEHALLSYVFAAEQFPPGAFKTLVTLVTEQTIYTDVFRANAADDDIHTYARDQESSAVKDALALRETALSNTDDTLQLDPHAWFSVEQQRLEKLQKIEAVVLGRISGAATKKIAATQSAIRLGVGLSAAVVLASAVLAWFILRGLTRAVFELSTSAARVRQTKDFSIRALKVSSDELGTLTDAFNEMLTDIQARDKELEEHRSNLEEMVAARTQQLEARNESMRLVLDTVEQGLVTVARDGTIGEERSAAFDEILGAPPEGVIFADHVARSDERAREMLKLGWEMVLEDMMPRDVAIDQLPKRIDHEGRHLTFDFKPIVRDEVFEGALLMVSDVTAEVNARLEQEKQREYVAVFERVAQDRDGFVDFTAETGALLARLEAGVNEGPAAMAIVHTVKGNAAQWGVSSVARIAHELETQIVDTGTLPTEEQKAELFAAWAAIQKRFSTLAGAHPERLEVSRSELANVIAQLRAQAPQHAIADQLESLKHEPTRVRFGRMIDEIERLAGRLGKPKPEVRIEAHGVRLPASRFASFWASTVHVVRNLIDHGIEAPAQRVAASKPEAGTIVLRSTSTPEHFAIAFEDDGKGIDWEAIAGKAREAGLPADTHEDLVRALFTSGVSTAKNVTDISGRGVGLSAVLERCRALGGHVDVESRPGQGTSFVFTFPRHLNEHSLLPAAPALRRAS